MNCVEKELAEAQSAAIFNSLRAKGEEIAGQYDALIEPWRKLVGNYNTGVVRFTEAVQQLDADFGLDIGDISRCRPDAIEDAIMLFGEGRLGFLRKVLAANAKAA